MKKTNIYGPRPNGAGFRCRECGATEGPLFGFAEARKHEPESNTNTVCAPCISTVPLRGIDVIPTSDAAEALGRLGYALNTRRTIELVKVAGP